MQIIKRVNLMGVGELGEILEKKEISFQEARGKVAVDAFNTLYQFISTIRQKDGTLLMDSQGRITSHLSGLFYRTCNLIEKGIKPIYVFDGTPSLLKKGTIEEREEKKQKAEEELKKAVEEGRIEELKSIAQRTARLGKEQIIEAKKLLELMGIPFIQAKSEGEAQCSQMAASGIVSAACSQDFDCMLFGAPRLIRNLTIAGRRKLPKRDLYIDILPEEYLLQENLEKLGINRRKLIWIGILVGTDFNKGIHGIGPKKALKLVKEHNEFNQIEKSIKQEINGFEEIEELFLNPNVREVALEEIQFKPVQREKLIEFMCEERDFSKERIESALEKAFKEQINGEQSSLEKWF